MAYKPPEWSGPLRQPISLEFVVGGSVQKRQELTSGKDYFLVGRHAKQCDIVLEKFEPKASRVHAVLQCKEDSDELFVFDMGSTHGTLLNNRRVDPQTYTPVAVGHQLRFCADGSECLVLICGPDELMDEEGEVDLTELRLQAQKEKREADQDLARRKAAKKERMMREKTREAVAKMYAEKARQKQQVVQEAIEKDREKLHEVTWGMSADAVEVKDDGLSDEAQKLLEAGDSGWIDPEKVRNYKSLTDKQEQMIAKFEQKKKKLEGLQQQKAKLEGRIKKNSMQASADDDCEFDPGMAKMDRDKGVSTEHHARVEQKLITLQEEVVAESDRVLISLGLKTAEMSEKQKKERAAMYDTNVMGGEDDDFFDRTAKPAAKQGNLAAGKKGHGAAADSEFADLPQVGKGVETKETLEQKVKQLQTEKAHVGAKVAMTEVAMAKYEKETADELDAFMMGNEKKLVTERLAKLRRRLEKVNELLDEATKMLKVAQRNSDGDPTVASVIAAAKAAAAVKKASTPAPKAAADSKASFMKMAAGDAQTADKKGDADPKAAAEALAAKKREALQAAEDAAKGAKDESEQGAPTGGTPGGSGSNDSSSRETAAAASDTAQASGDEAAMPPPKPLLGKKVYGVAPRAHIDAGRGGLQLLAAPTAPKRKADPSEASSEGDEAAAQRRRVGPTPPPADEANTAEMAPPKRKVYGVTLPPPGGSDAPGADVTGDMPPPKRKVYGVTMPPPSTRDSDEHFE